MQPHKFESTVVRRTVRVHTRATSAKAQHFRHLNGDKVVTESKHITQHVHCPDRPKQLHVNDRRHHQVSVQILQTENCGPGSELLNSGDHVSSHRTSTYTQMHKNVRTGEVSPPHERDRRVH